MPGWAARVRKTCASSGAVNWRLKRRAYKTSSIYSPPAAHVWKRASPRQTMMLIMKAPASTPPANNHQPPPNRELQTQPLFHLPAAPLDARPEKNPNHDAFADRLKRLGGNRGEPTISFAPYV